MPRSEFVILLLFVFLRLLFTLPIVSIFLTQQQLFVPLLTSTSQLQPQRPFSAPLLVISSNFLLLHLIFASDPQPLYQLSPFERLLPRLFTWLQPLVLLFTFKLLPQLPLAQPGFSSLPLLFPPPTI